VLVKISLSPPRESKTRLVVKLIFKILKKTQFFLQVTSAWAGFYDYNILDQNGIISSHAEIENFYLCNGFSGHGLQQSPAVGRAISELVIDGGFRTIDLSRFSFERFKDNKLIIENNII
jgi:sarcosine oxidase